jgi:hypothetical protein
MPCRASLKISWKDLFLGFFSCHLPNWMKNFTLSRLFFYLYLASKGDQITFYLFQLSTSLNCNITVIQFVFSRADSALCYTDGHLMHNMSHLWRSPLILKPTTSDLLCILTQTRFQLRLCIWFGRNHIMSSSWKYSKK